MGQFIEKLERISPLIGKHNFYETVQRTRCYWKSMQEYNLHENLAILGEGDKIDIIVPSYTNDKFTQLSLTKAGECACVTYCPTYGGVTLKIFIDENNKIKSILATDNDMDGRPVLDVFYGNGFVRLFHIVIPREELSETLFQFNTIDSSDLSFLEDFA